MTRKTITITKAKGYKPMEIKQQFFTTNLILEYSF